MQTNLAQWALDSKYGKEAEEILRRCVHCGFCLATCPTYQVTGDERDSPRGRIYLIKQVLEGKDTTRSTQNHLDRCLTCRNCETTCPSGVQYANLVDIGRNIVEDKVKRPIVERVKLNALGTLINSPVFDTAVKTGRAVKSVLPTHLKNKLTDPRPARELPPEGKSYDSYVILLVSCVQPTMAPSIDASTIRVLDTLGVGVKKASESGCCGAVNFHLNKQDKARDQMRANIDAWLPMLKSGQAEAVVMNASGCGAMVNEYSHHLRHDPEYSEKAKELSKYVVDIAEYVKPHTDKLKQLVSSLPDRPVFHPPCTLQHWQDLRGITEELLRSLGFDIKPFEESHLCCGAAGTYSITQPELSSQLQKRKVDNIQAVNPDLILSSNMGCMTQIEGGCNTPVMHWIEALDQAITAQSKS